MTDFSVTQYNPYNMYQNFGYYPAFRGATVPQNNYNSVPQMTQQPDTVSFSANGQIQAETQKKGLSKEAKWGIGAVAVLGLGALAYVLTKGKAGTKQVQQLAEHVDFQPAKTIEEAKLFAKEKLGVHIDGDLPVDVLNYANEGLCTLRNKAPKDFNIKWIESNPIGGGYDAEGLAQLISSKKNSNLYGINLSSNYIKNLDKTISELINGEIEKGALIKVNNKLQYSDLYARADISSEISELANRFKANPASLSFKDKVRLHLGICDIEEGLFIQCNGDISKLADNVKIISSPFHPIFHEEGHILHRMNITKDKFDLLDHIEILKQKGLDTSIVEEFKNKYQSIAGRVSDYAMDSPAEFVAEVYAKMLNGAKFDNEVMSLYAKYGGKPIIA